MTRHEFKPERRCYKQHDRRLNKLWPKVKWFFNPETWPPYALKERERRWRPEDRRTAKCVGESYLKDEGHTVHYSTEVNDDL